jgi:hypothetical protein
MENAFNTISRRSFLAELYKNPHLHPIIPLVEMIYYFDPNDASFLHGTVQSRTGVRQGDLLGPLLLNLAICTPSGRLENGARIRRPSKSFLTLESI